VIQEEALGVVVGEPGAKGLLQAKVLTVPRCVSVSKMAHNIVLLQLTGALEKVGTFRVRCGAISCGAWPRSGGRLYRGPGAAVKWGLRGSTHTTVAFCGKSTSTEKEALCGEVSEPVAVSCLLT